MVKLRSDVHCVGGFDVNLFEAILPPATDEQITPLIETPYLRIERIVSHGQQSPPDFWYDQNEDEWVYIVQGEGHLVFEDGYERLLKPGDYEFIPAHRRHRVAATAPNTIWLAVWSRSDPSSAGRQRPVLEI